MNFWPGGPKLGAPTRQFWAPAASKRWVLGASGFAKVLATDQWAFPPILGPQLGQGGKSIFLWPAPSNTDDKQYVT